MSQRVYRVCRARYARLDGEGAKRVGGRWNSPGKPVVYMAESIALAVLENLVHISRAEFPTGYVCIEAVLPEELSLITEDALRTNITSRRRSGGLSATSGSITSYQQPFPSRQPSSLKSDSLF